MAKTSEMRESKYLRKEDVGQGLLLTISAIERTNIAMEDQAPEYKWIMRFAETEKPYVMNGTSIQMCEHIYNSDESEDWIGNKIVLYNDPSVMFKGKITGGIRVRAPRKAKTVTHQPVVEQGEDNLDDPPF